MIDQQLADLAKQIEENPEDPELRRQRVQLILNAALDSTSLDKMDLIKEDVSLLPRLDATVAAEMREELQLFSTLSAIKNTPAYMEYYAQQFIRSHPKSEQAPKLYVLLARTAMKDAKYAQTSQHMKSYLEKYPQGGYVDEFNLLLPQIEDFLKLTKGVSFD